MKQWIGNYCVMFLHAGVFALGGTLDLGAVAWPYSPNLGGMGSRLGESDNSKQKYAPEEFGRHGSLLEEVGGRASQDGPPPTGEESCVALTVSNHKP